MVGWYNIVVQSVQIEIRVHTKTAVAVDKSFMYHLESALKRAKVKALNVTITASKISVRPDLGKTLNSIIY